MQLQKDKNEKDKYWRISSTLFSHVNTSKYLEVLPRFKNEENDKK